MSDDDKMDVAEVLRLLSRAIPLQMRSATLYTWAAGATTGVEYQAVGHELEGFGNEELNDARRLVEKMVALGGDPPSAVAAFEAFGSGPEGFSRIIELEEEATAAIHAVIPASGQEPRSEALEHLLEHILMRKHEQIDFLQRVLRGS